MNNPKHCDEYINDPEAPLCLRAFLEFNRRPAIRKIGLSPILFATLCHAVDGARHGPRGRDGVMPIIPIPLEAGQRIRITMASRLGDLGITPDLSAERGYVARLHVSALCDFSDEATQE